MMEVLNTGRQQGLPLTSIRTGDAPSKRNSGSKTAAVSFTITIQNLNATLKGKVFGLETSDRSRLEYRNRENEKDVWRYRNKVTVKLPVELTALKLQPYVAEELFINLDEEGFNRNRLAGGFYINLSKNIKGDIYYLWQTSKSDRKWDDINVIGTGLRFYF